MPYYLSDMPVRFTKHFDGWRIEYEEKTNYILPWRPKTYWWNDGGVYPTYDQCFIEYNELVIKERAHKNKVSAQAAFKNTHVYPPFPEKDPTV